MNIKYALILNCFFLAGCDWFSSQDESLSDAPIVEANAIEVNQRHKTSSLSTEKVVLNLNLGDRFPMKKTVESTLTQKMGTGTITNHSWLEMLMTIQVDKVEDHKTLLSVRFQRVRYRQQIGDQEINFDSSVEQKNLPFEALPYSGLVNNGFQFWLGPDNKILELKNFDLFLKKCAGKFPADQRNQLLTHLSESSGDDELANFVDDSIGILPYNPKTGVASVKEGDVWSRKRKFIHPTTMYLDSKCTLRKLTNQYAEIDIAGTIAATDAQQKSSGNEEIYIRIRDGKSLGKCTIDRASGLPVNSRIERTLDMLVFTSDGREIPQQKKIVTTIEAYPMDGDPALKRNSMVKQKEKTKNKIQQTSATQEKKN